MKTICLVSIVLWSAAATAPAAEIGNAQDLAVGERWTISSEILGEEREIMVGLPQGYRDGDQRYRVLYVLDGGWHFLPALSAVQNQSECSYINVQALPPLIVVGIVSVDRDRDDTPTHCPQQHGMLFPTSGGADQFLDFLARELIPAVDARYRTLPFRAVAGWSLGGLLVTTAYLERPEIFDAYLAISPSLWWDDRTMVTRALAYQGPAESRDGTLVMTIGTGEEGGLCYNAVQDLMAELETTPVPGFAPVLVEIPGESHNTGPLKAYYDGLGALFADWIAPDDVIISGVAATEEHYRRLSCKYKEQLDVPPEILYAMSRYMISEGRNQEAVAAAVRATELQPDSAVALMRLGDVYNRVERATEARQAFKKALAVEGRTDEPDTVFLGYVQELLQAMDDSGG